MDLDVQCAVVKDGLDALDGIIMTDLDLVGFGLSSLFSFYSSYSTTMNDVHSDCTSNLYYN